MQYRLRVWLAAFFCVILVGSLLGSVASAQELGPQCELEAIDGGVRCADLEILHPSLYPDPERYRERRDGEMPAGPVALDDGYFYAVGHELLRFDPVTEEIDDRVQLPAKIIDLDVDAEHLLVTLEAMDGDGEWVVIEYDPSADERPGRAPWNWAGTTTLLRDAMWLDDVELGAEPGASAGQLQINEADDRAAVATLEERESVDATNPYLALFRGEALERLGESEGAELAFEEAATHDHANWLDLIRIALRLEYRGYPDLATRAFDGAEESMNTAGVRGEYVTMMVNATFALVWMREVMEQALENEDFETIERVARRVDALFPNLEGVPAAWSRIGAYFAEHDQQDRADRWEERARELRGEERADHFFEDAARAVDRYLILQLGLLLTALLSGAILGLWRVDEKVREKRTGWRRFLPQFQAADLVLLAGLFVVLAVLPMTIAAPLNSMATAADAPPPITGDATAAPITEQWLSGLAESPSQQALIEDSRQEYEAVVAGAKGPGETDLAENFVEAIGADTEARDIGSLGDIEASSGVRQDFPWLGQLLDLEFDTTGVFFLFLMLGFNALVLGFLVQAAGRRIEVVGRVGRAVVPGAPNSLRFLRLPVLATFIIGLLMMTPLSRAVESMTEAELVGYFGLGQAPSGLSTTVPMVGFGLVAAALVVHAVGVVRDRRKLRE